MPDTSVVEDKGWTVPRILTAERRRLLERCLVVLALTVLPLAAYLLSSVMLEEKGPYWLAENSDPEYAYLLNALNVLEGRPPEHVDHPGTTLQMFGAVVIGLLTMGHSASDLIMSMLSRESLRQSSNANCSPPASWNVLRPRIPSSSSVSMQSAEKPGAAIAIRFTPCLG